MDLCIKCDKGGSGKLLTCHDNGCPIFVHEDCLGCDAQFDEMGNFYCPFCMYKRAVEEFTQAERNAVLAEKALSKYLDGKGLGTEAFETRNVTGSSDVRSQCVELEKDCQEVMGPECIMRDKGADVLLVNKESDVLLNRVGDNGGLNNNFNRVKVVEKQNELEHVVDECCSGEGKVDQQKDVDVNKRCQSEDKKENDATQTETVPKYHQDAGHFEAHEIMKENVVAVEENEGRMDEVQNQEQTHKTTEKIVCKESVPQVHMEVNRKVDDTTASTCMDTDTISEKVTGAQPPCVNNTHRRSSRKKKSAHIEKSSTPQVHMESAQQMHMEVNRLVDDTAASTCMDTHTISEKVTGAQPPCVSTPRRSTRKQKYVHTGKSSSPCKSSKVAKPPTIFTKLPTSKEECKRLAWKLEEEEMLKVHMESAQQVHMEVNRLVDDTAASTCMDTHTISEKVTGAQPPRVSTPRRSTRKQKSVHTEKSSSPCRSSKVAKPSTIFTKLPTSKEECKRLAWKV